MDTKSFTPAELLERATEFGKSHPDMQMIDCLTVLRGYVSLTILDPANPKYHEYTDNAARMLIESAGQHPVWSRFLELETALPVAA